MLKTISEAAVLPCAGFIKIQHMRSDDFQTDTHPFTSFSTKIGKHKKFVGSLIIDLRPGVLIRPIPA
jgi:hypothetical protein